MKKSDLKTSLIENIYSQKVINNSHRGDVAEMLVFEALKPLGFKFVGLGWHPWDLQYGKDESRVRVQVKQCAALQVWGKTKSMSIQFGWSKEAPFYFERDNPGEMIEKQGYFCEIIIVGLHLDDNLNSADQMDPDQWKFLVIPTSDLDHGQNSMVLTKALERWKAVSLEELKDKVYDLQNNIQKIRAA